MLLERDGYLEAVSAALGSAREGRGRLVVLEGHAGLGKSELLRAASAQAREEDFEVLSAGGAELEREFSFGAALQLVEPPLRAASEGERERLLAGAAGSARALLARGPPEGAGQSSTFPLLHGLLWVVVNLAERRPLLVAIDDAHWLDRPTLRFLIYLAQRVQDLPVGLVIALRPSEPGAPEDLLAPLATHPGAEVLRLQPLSDAATEELVRSRLPGAEPAFCRACAKMSGGNPFLLAELGRTLEAEGVEPVAASAPLVGRVAPDSVLRSTLGRLARVPGAAAALARAVAILGGDAQLRHAARLAEIGLEEAASAVDALAAAEILRPDEPLAFVHPLIHASIDADIPRGERGRAHLHAARLLSEEGAPSGRVAAHLLNAPAAGDSWVAERLREAARHATADGAPTSAALFLKRALAEPATGDARADVLVELGMAEAASGEPGAADRLEQALALTADVHRRAELELIHGRILLSSGRERDACEAFDRGLAELDGSDRRLAAQLEAAWLTASRHLPDLQPRAAERLQSLLMRPGPPETYEERWLLGAVANQRAYTGEPHEETVAIAKRALADGQLLREETSDGQGWFLAVAPLGWADDFESYEETCLEALADARRRGSIIGFANASYALSFSHFCRGRIIDSIADARQAAAAEREGWQPGAPAVRARLAWALIERDDLTGAERALEMPNLETDWADSALPALVKEARGQIALLRGDARGAVESLGATGELLMQLGASNPSIVPWRSRLALAVSALGEGDRALELAEEELRLARRFGARRPIGAALRALGLVSGEAGIELLREAVETLADSPAALEHARALVDLGGALRRAGQRREAREPLREGREMAQGFGALALERRALEELEAAGARPRRRELSGVESLTPSERRVAQMAGEGLSNREIAQALFVTVKAVQWHLRNCYRKLEIGGREELVGALGRRGAAAERPGAATRTLG